MRYFIILLLVLFCGCSQGPDFSTNPKVIKKTSYRTWTGKTNTIYRFYNCKNNARHGDLRGVIEFKAPISFAEIGDYITFTNGCLKASKTNPAGRK